MLALVSFVSLFLELGLIRWISTEVRVFGSVKNVALIACFVGLALGYPYVKRRLPLWACPLIQLLLVIAILPAEIIGSGSLKLLTQKLRVDVAFESLSLGPGSSLVPGVIELLMVFIVVMLLFLPIGQRIGELFRAQASPLRTYTYNVIASLLGVVCFTGLSLLRCPPIVWFTIGFGLLGSKSSDPRPTVLCIRSCWVSAFCSGCCRQANF